MKPQRQPRRSRNAARMRGFTLVELMMVVAITGILAAIAIPTFAGYIQRSRTSEATMFLSVIKLRQESYRAEFGQYLEYNQGGVVNDPVSLVRSHFVPDYEAIAGTEGIFPSDNVNFNQLGAKPDASIVRFGYAWAAGTPTQAGVVDNGTVWNMMPADHYFVAQARADLDADGIEMTFEVTNFTKGVWFNDELETGAAWE